MPEAAVRYVLNRLNWRRTAAGFVRLPGEVRVASFGSPEEADAERRRREAAARELVNPFAAGVAPFDQTSLPPPVFRDWLMDAGIDPPAEGADPPAWAKWWEKSSPTWSATQRARAWEGLDRVRFYEVAERPKRPVVYTIVAVAWAYNDEWYYADGEGGKVMEVYRSRRKAELACARMNETARDEWADIVGEDPDDGYGQFEITEREEATADPFDPDREDPPDEDTRKADEVPFYEVVEVELEDER